MMKFNENSTELQKVNPLEEPKLSEEEKILIDLFRRVPEGKHQLVLQMFRIVLDSQE